MRAKDIDTTRFKDVNDLYNFLEVHTYELERKLDITDPIIKFREQTTSKKDKKVLQWDLECFLFNFIGNTMFSFSTSNGAESGDKYEFPSLDKWQCKAFDYVVKRADKVKHPLLKATYNHLLWKAPVGIKHKKYAGIAVENYIRVIDHYIDGLLDDPEQENSFEITRKFKNLVALANETKLRLPEINSLAQRLLFNTPALKYYHKDSILETMLEFTVVFKKDSFDNTLSIYDDAVANVTDRTDYFTLANNTLKTPLRIASKIGDDPRKWHDLIGECYVKLADSETDADRGLIKQSIYTQAIVAFRQSGNQKRRKEIEVLHDATRETARLENVRIDYDPKTVTADKILKHSHEEVYHHLATAKYFPTKEFLKKTAVKPEAWLAGVNTIKFDINKNIRSLKSDSSDEGFWYAYSYQLKHSILPYLHYLFIPGIKSGKLGYLSMIEYLAKYSWLGQTFTKIDLGGQPLKYNWIGVIAPSLIEYFTQMQAALLDKTYRSNYILCVDSLTLKMEGILRDFAQKLNAGTSKGYQSGMQVRYIHELLQDDIIQNHFSEDDRIFFDFLFVNKEGIDIRNNVAHCFYDYSDYGFDQMHLLMAALLRIGRYKFTPLTKNQS
jgi:hypothetical protein